MRLRRCVISKVVLMAILPTSSALACPDVGYIEKLVEPAMTEDGFVKITQYYFGSSEQRIHKAKYEIMTREEYEALDANMIYEHYYWEYPKISKTRIEPATNIANYDLVRTIDGNSFYRPLEQLDRKNIENHDVELPRKRRSVTKTIKRPEPEVLKNGRLRVMISPMHYENLANGVQKAQVWSHYIKSRTPAVYQQVKCNEDKF